MSNNSGTLITLNHPHQFPPHRQFRVFFNQLSHDRFGFCESSLVDVKEGEGVEVVGVVLFDFQGVFEGGFRFAVPGQLLEQQGEVVVGGDVLRLEGERLLEALDGQGHLRGIELSDEEADELRDTIARIEGTPLWALNEAGSGKADPETAEVVMLDQRLLPGEVRYHRYTKPDEVVEAIRNMVVRGAPAIGATAAYGMCLALRDDASDGLVAFHKLSQWLSYSLIEPLEEAPGAEAAAKLGLTVEAIVEKALELVGE